MRIQVPVTDKRQIYGRVQVPVTDKRQIYVRVQGPVGVNKGRVFRDKSNRDGFQKVRALGPRFRLVTVG